MKIIAWIIFTLSLMQVVLGIGKVLIDRNLIDFAVYYQAAKASLEGLNPYSQTYGDFIAYNYPPSALVFLWPFTIFSQLDAQILFTTLSLIALLTVGLILTQSIPLQNRTPIRLIILSLLLQNFPTKFTLVMGQVNMFVLLFLVLTFLADHRRRFILSGIFWGLASMIKLTPLTLGVYFVLRRKYLSLITGLGLFALINFFMLSMWQGTDVFFSSILPQLITQPGTQASLYDQSLRAFFARLGLGDKSTIISGLITLILFGLATLKYKLATKKTFNEDLVFFSLILAITTIGSSYTWQHHLVFLFPGFIAETLYLLGLIKKTSPPKFPPRGFLLLVSTLLVGYHFPDISHPPTTNPLLISHSLFGALILIGLLFQVNSKTQSRMRG